MIEPDSQCERVISTIGLTALRIWFHHNIAGISHALHQRFSLFNSKRKSMKRIYYTKIFGIANAINYGISLVKIIINNNRRFNISHNNFLLVFCRCTSSNFNSSTEFSNFPLRHTYLVEKGTKFGFNSRLPDICVSSIFFMRIQLTPL